MKQCLKIILLFLIFPVLSYTQEVIPISSTSSPASIEWNAEETQPVSQISRSPVVANVSQPSLTVYRPDPGKANGTALIIAPGGGFHFLSFDNEGTDVASWCVERGITAFVLKYRLVPTGEDPFAEFIQKVTINRDEMDKEIRPFIKMATADGLAAVEYVRNQAGNYHLDKNKIGIIGFSAGGTVAGSAAFHHTEESRPDFVVPIYAAMHVVDMSEMPKDPMPLFIAVTSDDTFGFQNQSLDLYRQWNKAQEPVELHVYSKGGHGFGMRKQNLTSDHWIDQFESWLSSLSFL